jgi:hypothetical protein
VTVELEGVTFVPGQRPPGVEAENVPGGWNVTLPSGRVVRWGVGLGNSTSKASRWRLVEVQVLEAPPEPPAQPEPLLSAAELAAMSIRDMTPAQIQRRDLLVAMGEIVVVPQAQHNAAPFESMSTRRYRALAEFDQRPEVAEWVSSAREAAADKKAKARL